MPYCANCGEALVSGDKYCSGCGRPAVFPKQKKRSTRHNPEDNENLARLSQEKEAAKAYYQAVGSRHPHIWPVSGMGQAFFCLCLAAVGFFAYTVTGMEVELRHNPAARLALTALVVVVVLLFLNMIRWLFIPEVRPGSNPELVGSKGDFLVFIIGGPLVLLAILGWLDWLDPLFEWIKGAIR